MESEGYIVYTNPTIKNSINIGGYYPDIVAFSRNGEPSLIVEVESLTSVNAEEAQQWKKYAELGIPLILCVPKEKYELAHILCKKKDIPIHRILMYE